MLLRLPWADHSAGAREGLPRHQDRPHDINENILPPAIASNKSFFKTFFESVIFPDAHFAVIWHPVKNFSNNEEPYLIAAIDINVRVVGNKRMPICITLHAPFADCEEDGDIKYDWDVGELEARTCTECQRLLSENRNMNEIFAVTIIGTKIRCWYHQRGMCRLHCFWENGSPNSLNQYLDVGLDENEATLKQAFLKMHARMAGSLPLESATNIAIPELLTLISTPSLSPLPGPPPTLIGTSLGLYDVFYLYRGAHELLAVTAR